MFAFQKTVTMTLLVGRDTSNIFSAVSLREAHCFDRCLVLDELWIIHVSCMVERSNKLSGLRLINAFEVFTRLRL